MGWKSLSHYSRRPEVVKMRPFYIHRPTFILNRNHDPHLPSSTPPTIGNARCIRYTLPSCYDVELHALRDVGAYRVLSTPLG